MDLKIIGEHIEVSEPIRDYIIEKFKHLPIPDKMHHAEFRIGKDGNHIQHVKFSANFNHKNLTIDVKADNVYHAVDQLMKKLHTNLTKDKEKDKSHNKHLHKIN